MGNGIILSCLSAQGINAPWLIGQMVSNGCIRMHNAHAEEIFTLINIGTPMYIRD
ncbi:L,D-transpeptidase [Sporomusa silvacetica]|uniref:L,D-transpeptidase n=1 Tax=Sporomusa silvacetica TaxID=55504 RepID=UPI00359F4D0D